jgi:hypothetical protein
MTTDRRPEALVDKAVFSADGDHIGMSRGVVADGAGNVTHVVVELPGAVERTIPITGSRPANDRLVVTYTSEEILQMPAPKAIT